MDGRSTGITCNGSYGTVPALDGKYDLIAFGCWTDASGVKQGDPGANCLPRSVR